MMKRSYSTMLVTCRNIRFFYYCVFSVPFDEDDRDDSVWFLDHDYLENMYGMFKKVNGEQHLKISQCSVLTALFFFTDCLHWVFFQQEKELSGGTTQDPSCTKMILPSMSSSNSTVPTRYVTSHFSTPTHPSYVTSGVKLFIYAPLLFLQVLVIIDVKPKDLGLPTEAYFSVEEIHDVSWLWMTNTNSLAGPSN